MILTKKEYKQLVDIYLKNVETITGKDLILFNTILEQAPILYPAKIQLLGDDLADRGSNDYFILKIMAKLSREQIPFEVLLSNHNIEFIWSYERGLREFISLRIGFAGQDNSLENLGRLIHKNILEDEEVENIKQTIERNYLPHLKPISYTLDKLNHSIILYSHAPIGFDVIKLLAEWLAVPYADDKIENLVRTIDKINTAFKTVALKHDLTKLCKTDHFDFISKTNPFYLITWKRGYEDINILAKKNHYHIHYVHGHDGVGHVDSAYQHYVTNLDNLLGKGPAPKNPNDRLGKYEVLVTKVNAY